MQKKIKGPVAATRRTIIAHTAQERLGKHINESRKPWEEERAVSYTAQRLESKKRLCRKEERPPSNHILAGEKKKGAAVAKSACFDWQTMTLDPKSLNKTEIISF